ncbi:MtrB/PioB family decaheme-associated outer membrane protein [Sideroxydans sp. CL21]|uniref:MtrB/PioB family decaheme-associated outer membrane protein n=1 Tax=Sideroxydans sp. CL21 TaxID=2600596 RepID=UPI0024BC1CE8|nr:MtrB/PioB family decaheme-associated outer membrane protein [Sideroxydans sp. CL21]
MKTKKELFEVSKLTLAVQGALLVMLAMPLVAKAEDADVAALTHPTDSVDVGVETVSKDSAKFGEYNGLNKKGAYLIGNFKAQGGDAFNSYDGGDGLNRWEFKGNDLGTTSREIGANMSKQGKWSFGVGYDELRHNITDTYQTPLQGSMGGNSFILPSAFGVIDSRTKPAAVGGVIPPYGAQALTPNQLANFHNEDVHSDRKNAKFNAGYHIDQQWSVQFDYNRLTQDGAKLISAASDANLANASIGAVRGENILMLMNPTNYQTDTMNLALNWMGDKSHFTGSYYFSKFSDTYNGVNFSNPFFQVAAPNTTGWNPGVAFPVDTLSTAPDNYFQQLNLNGGYDISQATKLVGGVSYGRTTQNASFNNQDQMQAGGLPQSSLNGLVVTKHVDLKLTNQTTKDLSLSAGMKFNDHDNQTASNVYKFNDLGAGAETSISTPMSNKKTQFELAADYRVSQHQKLNIGFEHEQIQRWCDSSLTVAQIVAASGGPGGAINSATSAAYYANGASCVQVPNSTENKLAANYRLQASDDVKLNAGYSYARRRADVNSSFYNPMQAKLEGYELPGYVAFFDASRNEQMLKAGVNWQASEKLNVGLNGRYVNDNYSAVLGVQNGTAWSANLDVGYNFAENTSATAYVTLQNRKRDLANDQWGHTTATYGTAIAGGSLTQPWTNTLSQDDSTVGINAKHGGLMQGKLDLAADLTYSFGKTSYRTTDNWVNTSCTGTSNGGYACGSTPDIKNEMLQLRLAGDYKLDKASKVRLAYIYQNLRSNDYYYNAYQTGYTATSMLPTNQQSPSYAVSVVSASYFYMF